MYAHDDHCTTSHAAGPEPCPPPTAPGPEYVRWWWFKVAGFCGCGRPEDVLGLLRDRLVEYRRSWAEDECAPALDMTSAGWLLLYQLDAWGLTEHGGGVGGSWLTAAGKLLLESLLLTPDLGAVLDG